MRYHRRTGKHPPSPRKGQHTQVRPGPGGKGVARPRRWWEAHADDLRRLSTKQFAARHHAEPATICSWRVKLGIPAPAAVAGAKRKAWWHAHADDLRRMGNVQFMAVHKVAPSVLTRWRRRLGIPSPVPVGPPPRADWSAVDWSKNDARLARELGVCRQTVVLQRSKREAPPTPGAPRKGR